MKDAILDIAQAVGCWVGSFFSAGVFLGFVEGLALLEPEGVLYANPVALWALALPGFLYSMIKISRWRQRSRSERQDELALYPEQWS